MCCMQEFQKLLLFLGIGAEHRIVERGLLFTILLKELSDASEKEAVENASVLLYSLCIFAWGLMWILIWLWRTSNWYHGISCLLEVQKLFKVSLYLSSHCVRAFADANTRATRVSIIQSKVDHELDSDLTHEYLSVLAHKGHQGCKVVESQRIREKEGPGG